MELGVEMGSAAQGRGPSGLRRRRTRSERNQGRSSPVTSMRFPAKRRSRINKLNAIKYLDNSSTRFDLRRPRAFGTRRTHSFSVPQLFRESLMPSVESKKNVKIVGTNSISPLESIKVAKNELRTNSQTGAKPCSKGAKLAKMRPRSRLKIG